jgi:hypothetical protein
LLGDVDVFGMIEIGEGEVLRVAVKCSKHALEDDRDVVSILLYFPSTRPVHRLTSEYSLMLCVEAEGNEKGDSVNSKFKSD